MKFSDEFLRQSALVVAHPDDDILWFSSIIEKVGKVFICFLGNPQFPDRGDARLRVLSRYPLDNIECLGIDVSPSFGRADWLNPEETKSGMRLSQGEAAYQNNHQQLHNILSSKLQDFQNVFTHNPWGEYGHEEHVQVSRVVHQLSAQCGYQTWFSNYASPRSSVLASRYQFGKYEDWVTRKTRPQLGEKIKQLYIEEGCWTAPGDFAWFPEECFSTLQRINETGTGQNLFPLNFLSWPSDIPNPQVQARKQAPQAVPVKEQVEKPTRKQQLERAGIEGPMPSPERWVFIVGCYNSGTTLLENLIKAHPLVGGLPSEGHVCSDQFVIPMNVGLPRLWAIKPELFVMNENDEKGVDADKVKRQWGAQFSDHRLPVLVEKSCPNTGRTRWLQKHFKNAFFIGLVRNGYAVAEGISRKAGHPIATSAQQWLRSNQIMLEDFEHLKDSTIIRYEDLAENPKQVMDQIWQSIGIDMDIPELDESYSIHGKVSKIQNMNDKSFAVLDDDSKQQIRSIAGDMLDRFGYTAEK